jgi:hypothetical protein
MNNPDKIFKDKLFDLETPLGGSVSFDKVMAMRDQSRRPVWWKPALLVLSTLSVVSLTGYFAFRQTGMGAMPSGSQVAQESSKDPGSNVASNHGSGNVSIGAQQEAPTSGHEMIQPRQGNWSSNKAARPANNSATEKTSDKDQDNAYQELAYIDASGLQGFGIKALWNNFELGDSKNKLKLAHKFKLDEKEKNLPAIELMMATGGREIRDFQGQNPFSIRGNHRFGQYSAVALWDAGNGFQLGAGIGYSQFAGNGEWRKVTPYSRQQIDTNVVIIVQPGFPNKIVTTYDTSNISGTDVQTGAVKYQLSKISVPLAFRYHIGQGRSLFRISATLSPGLLSSSSGQAFNKNSYMEVNNRSNNFTLDARLGLGLHYLMSSRTALIIEPGATYQSVMGAGWQPYNRVGIGMGFGLVIKL